MKRHVRSGPTARRGAAGALRLRAYRVSAGLDMPVVPAPATRAWMDGTDQRFANRCLPLLLANQSGWVVLSSHALQVTWTGAHGPESLQLEYADGAPPYPALSHFGHGILTWHLPYLFRTPTGYNLLVRGPANWPKDGVAPLEGLVETDWSLATFTMNWQLTRPNAPVTFARGEPICMLVPQRRGELEAFRPELRAIETDPPTQRGYQAWSHSRAMFLAQLTVPGSDAVKRGWQKQYFQGRGTDGAAAPVHQTKLRLQAFAESESE